MKIHVLAKTNARREQITKSDNTHFTVAVHAVPKNGKANDAIQRALADYFDVAPSRIVLIFGFTGKNKTFEIK